MKQKHIQLHLQQTGPSLLPAPHTHQRQSQLIAHDRLKRGKAELVGGLVEAVAEHRGREGGTKQAVEPWAGRERKRRGREDEEKRERRGE